MQNKKIQLNNNLLLFIKGVAMGSADIVPGVSGGTVAFITGIYEKLINTIKSFDANFFKIVFRFKIKEALESVDIKFLLFLLSGIVLALLSTARLITYLLHNFPEYTWSAFFGLILASVFILFKDIKSIVGEGGIGIIIGSIVAFFLVNIIPINTPDSWWFLILAGAIVISAMILPGLSGAFILLLLGKYEYMLNALKNPFTFDNFSSILFFVFGCAAGVMLFSRVVSYLFKKNHNLTVAILTGLIIGSLRKIWPWKEILEEKVVNGEVFVILEKNILPDFSAATVYQIILIVIGFAFVIGLNALAQEKD